MTLNERPLININKFWVRFFSTFVCLLKCKNRIETEKSSVESNEHSRKKNENPKIRMKHRAPAHGKYKTLWMKLHSCLSTFYHSFAAALYGIRILTTFKFTMTGNYVEWIFDPTYGQIEVHFRLVKDGSIKVSKNGGMRHRNSIYHLRVQKYRNVFGWDRKFIPR